jgi:hypothetical protein
MRSIANKSILNNLRMVTYDWHNTISACWKLIFLCLQKVSPSLNYAYLDLKKSMMIHRTSVGITFVPVLWVKELCLGFQQNSFRDGKCTCFFHFWSCIRKLWSHRSGSNRLYTYRRNIRQRISGRNGAGKGRCLNWRLYCPDRNCEGWGSEM